jgi:hypothetical protein
MIFVLEARAIEAEEKGFVVRISSGMNACFRFESNVISDSMMYVTIFGAIN